MLEEQIRKISGDLLRGTMPKQTSVLCFAAWTTGYVNANKTTDMLYCGFRWLYDHLVFIFQAG